MPSSPTIIITGATRGLGLAMARGLAGAGQFRLVLAVRDIEAGGAVAAELGRSVEVMQLDLESRSGIAAFARSWSGDIHCLINNAGGQFHGATQFTSDGVERTLALNHLGPVALTMALNDHLNGGTVINVGSGTHNPNDRLARLFGFRGGRPASLPDLAHGKTDAKTPRQAGLDRYATSKLLIMAATVELARRYSDTRFMVLDPGLMPGTGLVRSAPLPVRIAWNSVMKWAVPLIPGASTPEKSAETALRMVTDSRFLSGEIYGPEGDAEPVWEKVRDPDFGRLVLDETIAMLALGAPVVPHL